MSEKGFNDVIRMNEAVSGLASLRWRRSKQMNVNVLAREDKRERSSRKCTVCLALVLKWKWRVNSTVWVQCASGSWSKARYGYYFHTNLCLIVVGTWFKRHESKANCKSQLTKPSQRINCIAQSLFFHSLVDVSEFSVLLEVWTPKIDEEKNEMIVDMQ